MEMATYTETTQTKRGFGRMIWVAVVAFVVATALTVAIVAMQGGSPGTSSPGDRQTQTQVQTQTHTHTNGAGGGSGESEMIPLGNGNPAPVRAVTGFASSKGRLAPARLFSCRERFDDRHSRFALRRPAPKRELHLRGSMKAPA